MRIISIGDLVTDYYYKNEKILGLNGGMSSHNIILNLAYMKNDTKVIGCCGNDMAGKISIKSLEENGVDINDVTIINGIKTRCFHVSYYEENNKLNFSSKKRCPLCNQKNWYENSLIDYDKLKKIIKMDDILIFDNLNNTNQKIINSFDNLKLIDLGQYFEFENLNNEEILDKIKGKFTIINLNQRVGTYFLKRFKLKKIEELYNILNTPLIIITNGKNGASFIYDDKIYKFPLEKITKEVDPTGAGDAFFASIINSWIKNNLQFDINKFQEWFWEATKLTGKVVKKMGARGHINTLYKIKKVKDCCYCENFEIATRKQIKRCNINVNNLKIRIINALNSNATKDFANINFNKEENYLFVGTGGSFAAAKFAEIVTNHYFGCNSLAILPRNILNRNNSNIDKVFAFSYSGTTSDLVEAIKEFDNKNKYIITKGEKQKVTIKTGIQKANIISYRTGNNKGKEKGFLSFEGVLVPACLFLKEIDKKQNVEKFVCDSIDYWQKYFESEFKNKNVINLFKNNQMLNIFNGDYSVCAGIDFESKIIESGIFDCILHEKKNFSHGRFVNHENRKNKNNIYFKQNTTSKYEKLLLSYLSNDNMLIIESKYNGILAELDLLIASQYLVYYIGNLLDIDMSKPKYSEEAMKIYFYKGSL